MEVITSFDELKSNIEELEKGKNDNKYYDEYLKLIKRGTCFFTYISNSRVCFAPSRFIGYKNNKLATHSNNPERDGRVTSKAINILLSHVPIAHPTIERLYKDFCIKQLDFTPNETGTFGVKRKYWTTQEVIEVLENKVTDDINNNSKIDSTEKSQIIKARLGQGIYRDNLIKLWGKCCVSGCDLTFLLRASHIKPWRDSDNNERLDKYNGLLLSPNIDILFDKGLISFDVSGKIIISPKVSNENMARLGISKDIKINLYKENLKYLEWHRDYIFSPPST